VIVDERLTSLAFCGFSASIFAVLFLRKTFGMVTVDAAFVFHRPFMTFLCVVAFGCHFVLETLWYVFSIYITGTFSGFLLV
jgi:hypothetical protein